MDTLNIFGKTISPGKLLLERNLPDLVDARNQMVENLRKLNQFDEKVLDALKAIPRHAFAPPALWRVAYADVELYGPGIFLPKPNVVAKIAQAILQADAKKVLEYGTGTGYLSAVLSLLINEVYTVEYDAALLWLSADAFKQLDTQNIQQRASDGTFGWNEHAPYDATIVTGAIPEIVEAYTSQVADNGILIAPVGAYFGPQQLTVWKNMDTPDNTEDLGPCFFPPLLGAWTVNAALAQENTSDQHADNLSFWNQPVTVTNAANAADTFQPFLSTIPPLEGGSTFPQTDIFA